MKFDVFIAYLPLKRSEHFLHIGQQQFLGPPYGCEGFESMDQRLAGTAAINLFSLKITVAPLKQP
ncbi:hypothetical protein D3C75_979050 [compost metagenome]